MKLESYDQNGQLYTYCETLFGVVTLYLNGEALQKVKRRVFLAPDGQMIETTGNYFHGVTLEFQNGTRLIVHKYKFYEWILLFLPFTYIGLMPNFDEAFTYRHGIHFVVWLVLTSGVSFTLPFLLRSNSPIRILLSIAVSVLGFVLLFLSYTLLF